MKTIRRSKLFLPGEEGIARKTMRGQLLLELAGIMKDEVSYEVSFRETLERRDRRTRLAITLRYLETYTR